jgi:hypothetical protein
MQFVTHGTQYSPQLETLITTPLLNILQLVQLVTWIYQLESIYRKQDRHCTYNVTLRRVRATIVAVEKQYVLQIVSVCMCTT